jgi:SWI/SNF-related matrix-associated actin-dependent regulator 1 of chromatin subfamily A
LAQGAEGEQGYVRWMAANFRDGPWKQAATDALAVQVDAEPIAATTLQVGCVDDRMAWIDYPYDPAVTAALRSAIDGLNWHRASRRWLFPRAQLLRLLDRVQALGHAVDLTTEAADAVAAERARRATLDTIRAQGSSGLQVPTVLPLFPFQTVGVEFVLAAGGRAAITDEMGLGKTPQGIGVCLMLSQQQQIERTLVLCPASLKINWYREFRKFADLEATIWSGKKVVGDRTGPVHIVNYDIFPRFREEFEELGIDLLIADEAHYLKNGDSLRTQAVFGGTNKKRKRVAPFAVPYAVLLTGTPVLNRPGEMYSLLHYLYPDRFPDWYSFANRYGAFPPGNLRGLPSTPRNLDELHERTKDVVIRRRKAEVMPELPPLLVSELYVELSATQRKAYQRLLGDLATEWTKDAKAKRRPSLQQLQVLTAFLNEVKLVKVRELLAELLADEGRQVLVFCTRLAPLQALRQELGDQAMYIDGKMSPTARMAEVDRFQAGLARAALLSIRAAGVGLTLTNADVGIFIDQDFVPATHQQAEARAHRFGQVNPVNMYYVLVDDTIDIDLRALLAEKLLVTSQVTDGMAEDSARLQSVFTDFVRRLRARYTQFAEVLDPGDNDD